MSNQFNYSISKKTFGNFGNTQEAGNYINHLSRKIQTSKQSDCITFNSVSSQGEYLKSMNNKIERNNNFFSFNKANLNMNLVNKLNLQNVCVLKDINGNCPANISSTAMPFLTYTIDPSGSLFGNSICGLNNYTNYLECIPNNGV